MCLELEPELGARGGPPTRVWVPAIALGVIVGVVHAIDVSAGAAMYVAVTAGITLLFGLMCWSERYHRRRAREALLEQARLMLRHQINNQLQIVVTHLEDCGQDGDVERMREALEAVQSVTRVLNELSLERVVVYRDEAPVGR